MLQNKRVAKQKGCGSVRRSAAPTNRRTLPMKVGDRQSSQTVWLLRTVLVVTLALPVVSAVAEDAAGKTTLRLACFNTQVLTVPGEWSRLARFRFSPGRLRHLEGIAAVIEAVNPDILVLSEVTSSATVATLAEILREKGLGDFRGYHLDGRDSFTGFDVAFLSRVPPDSVAGATVHLFAPAKMPRLKAVQAGQDALPWTAEREILPRGYLPIVLGDLNDYDPDVPMADDYRTTQTEVLRHLKDINPEAEGIELVNAAQFMPRIADRFSSHWDYNENGAADGDDVFTLIDHILLDQRFVPGLRRAFICHASSLEVSDHFPVVVDLDLSVVPQAP
ncbi:MAG: endonuclease/exonuclease/phosphatase family protein [Planctomycetia bacterium]|nr:endonuclease/exonuclease/phosphatase family protein [Planctomycetia bacterium]